MRVTPEQLLEWRLALSWNDGAGLEASTVEQLLAEVERLQSEIEQLLGARRGDGTSAAATSH